MGRTFDTGITRERFVHVSAFGEEPKATCTREEGGRERVIVATARACLSEKEKKTRGMAASKNRMQERGKGGYDVKRRREQDEDDALKVSFSFPLFSFNPPTKENLINKWRRGLYFLNKLSLSLFSQINVEIKTSRKIGKSN